MDSLVMKIRAKNKFAAIRPARPGDVVVMLAMKTDELHPELAGYLQTLQNIVTGFPPDMIHVTLQRFGSATPEKAIDLYNTLATLEKSLNSFEVIANDYLPVYSDFRDIHLLKWVVPESKTLSEWYEIADEIGKKVGLKPLYLRQGFGAWVTALLEIDPSKSQALNSIPILNPLFRVNRLVISKLLDHGSFKLVGEFLF